MKPMVGCSKNSGERFALFGNSSRDKSSQRTRKVTSLKFLPKKGELGNCVEGIFDHISSAPGNRSTTLGPHEETWLSRFNMWFLENENI